MIEHNIFLNIRKEAISSMNTDSDGEKIKKKCRLNYLILFYFIPFLAALTPWVFYINLEQFYNYIAIAVSIFTGLFFSLLLNISSKIRIEKENEDIDISNFLKYKESMKQISNITQYVILLGIIIVFFILINYLVAYRSTILSSIFGSIIIFVLVRYLMSVLSILQRFHYILKNEINNIL